MTSAVESLTVSISVNGQQGTHTVPARMTLAQFIRDQLGLTGTKISCELQVCGVCSVLVDGRPVSSCTFLAADADGCDVATVEGLSANGLDPLAEAFAAEFALQCGFCTPGFLMMAKALLRANPHPTREEIVDHLDGNICRCTGYEPIIEAVLAAAGGSDD
jgi:aerobic-type carbon monoxide dehydrogenase small subunit (CoxS/CutS family)